MPNHDGIMPNDAATMPNDTAIMPNDAPSMPNHGGSMPNHDGIMPNDAANMPNATAIMPNDAPSMPSRAASMASTAYPGKALRRVRIVLLKKNRSNCLAVFVFLPWDCLDVISPSSISSCAFHSLPRLNFFCPPTVKSVII